MGTSSWLELTEADFKRGGIEGREIGDIALYMRWVGRTCTFRLLTFKFGSQVISAEFDNFEDAREAAIRVERDAVIALASEALGLST